MSNQATSFTRGTDLSETDAVKEAKTKEQFNGHARGTGRGPNPIYDAGYKLGGEPTNQNDPNAQKPNGPRKPYPTKSAAAQKQPKASRDLTPKGMRTTVKTQSFEAFKDQEAKKNDKLSGLFKKIDQQKAHVNADKPKSTLKSVANRSFTR